MKFINLNLFGGRGVSSGLYNYTLPKNPAKSKRFEDITHPIQKQRTNSREYLDNKEKIKIRFDKGNPKELGWAKEDHYHIYNPYSTGDHDKYLDKDGIPCPDGSKRSHLKPGEYENLLRRIK